MMPSQPATPEDEVARICASPSFRASPALARLLRYLVREARSGRGSQLNQYLIATDGMGLGHDFDPSKNAIVRVQGRRLRLMLTAYYRGPGRSNPLRIRLPERTFCPVFEAHETPPPPAPTLREAPVAVAVLEFRSAGLRGEWRHFPALLAENIVACLITADGIVPSGPFGQKSAERPDADFLLDGSIRPTAAGCRVHARLLHAADGTVHGAEAFEIRSKRGRMPPGDLPLARQLASFVAGTFAAPHESPAPEPAAVLAGNDAMMLVWHAYSTMAPRDIQAARRAMQSRDVRRKTGETTVPPGG